MKQRVLLAIMISLILLLPMVIADAGPKPSVNIYVTYEDQIIAEEFPAEMLVCYSDDLHYSTGVQPSIEVDIYDEANDCHWRPTDLVWGRNCTDSKCYFTYMLPDEFRLAVYLPSIDKTFVSNEITRDNFRSVYALSLYSDGSATIEETTPFYKNTQIKYFITALIITLIIELLVALLFFKVTKIPRKALLYVLIANLISLPLVWFLFPLLPMNFFLMILLAEIFVFLFEAYFITLMSKKKISLKRSFLLSMFMNLASIFIGGFFLFVAAMIGL